VLEGQLNKTNDMKKITITFLITFDSLRRLKDSTPSQASIAEASVAVGEARSQKPNKDLFTPTVDFPNL
jgi:hypothetical protein